jgi:pimeloyl-ACP methyl ester carboxylesterase
VFGFEMSRSREDETLAHSSGNTIGLAHYGNLNGPVIFYFHDQGSSRLEGVWWAKPAEAVGVHIIALDRPGTGLSSVQPNRTMLDWPLVVSEVAQRLNIGQFYVLGGELGGT